MALYGGIDLHSNNNVIVIIDEQDQVVDHKRLPNELDRVVARLAPHQAELRGLVVESTYNWYWLVDGLMEAGHRVHLANTAAIQQYEGIKFSNDFSDAQWLAHMLRLDILPEGYIYPKEERGVRDLIASACNWCNSAPEICQQRQDRCAREPRPCHFSQ